MRFEGQSSSSRSYEQQEIVEKASDKAAESLSELAIDPRDFMDLYGKETVEEDLAYVSRREEDFAKASADEKETVKTAKIAEAVLGDGIGLHDWLGPSAYFIVPSAYDDYKNGIDGLVEFEEEGGRASHMGLAVDATYRNESESKLYTIKEKIIEGNPMMMKYFTSEAMDFRGELRSVPRTVAAFDYGTIARLGELWLTKDKEALAQDPMQFQLMEQLIAQCELFEGVARGVDRQNLAGRYEHARETLKGIHRQRSQEIEDSGVRDNNSYRLLSSIDYIKRNF